MKIIISPAKKMNADPDAFPASGLPCFLPETRQLLVWLRERSYEELKSCWDAVTSWRSSTTAGIRRWSWSGD